MGVSSTVVMPDAYAKFLHWMPGQDTAPFTPSWSMSAPWSRRRTCCSLDYNAPSSVWLVEAVQRLRQRGQHRGDIDHHQEPEPFADVMLSDPTTGSTCELIYRLLQSWGMEEAPDADLASCLYCGLITDTGSLRFSSVQPPATTWPLPCSRRAWTTVIPDLRRLPLGTGPTHGLRLEPEASSLSGAPQRHHQPEQSAQGYNAQRRHRGPRQPRLAIKGINFAAFIKEDVDRVKMSLRSRERSAFGTWQPHISTGRPPQRRGWRM